MAYPYTADGAKEFLDYLINKGLLNANTAGGMKSACEKVFSVLDPDERQNLNGLDVDAAIKRFANKNPGTLSPDSLGVYRSRVQKVLSMLGSFNLDPANFRVTGAARTKAVDPQNGQRNKQVSREKQKAEQASDRQVSQHHASSSEDPYRANSVTLMFPLRPDFIAQFVMPKDLSLRDAKKLAAYFELIAVDYEPS